MNFHKNRNLDNDLIIESIQRDLKQYPINNYSTKNVVNVLDELNLSFYWNKTNCWLRPLILACLNFGFF